MKTIIKTISIILFTCTTYVALAQCPYVVTVNAQDALCNGTATGSAAATISGGSGPFYYSWNTTPVQTGTAIANVPAGNYTLTVEDGNGCKTTTLFTIAQPVSLTVSVPNPDPHCQGSPFQTKSVVSGGTPPYTYQWGCLSGNCGINNPNAVTPDIRALNNDIYFLQIIDANNCGTSDFFEVKVKEKPGVNVSGDVTIYLGEQAQLNASSISEGSYFWSPAQTLNNPNIQNPIATPEAQTTYTVIFVNKEGCRDTANVTVFVNTDLVIPTGLTPNGDNINDVWDVKGLTIYPNRKTEVFNRNGNRVFLGHGANDAWDGTYNGNLLPAGTYFFVIDPGDGNEIIKGYLTLIR